MNKRYANLSCMRRYAWAVRSERKGRLNTPLGRLSLCVSVTVVPAHIYINMLLLACIKKNC